MLNSLEVIGKSPVSQSGFLPSRFPVNILNAFLVYTLQCYMYDSILTSLI